MKNKIRRINFFKKHKLFSFICLLCSYCGFYLTLEWSNNKLFPSAEMMGLEMTNRFKDFMYRLKIIYLNKKEQKLIKKNNLSFYSNDLKFILLPGNYKMY